MNCSLLFPALFFLTPSSTSACTPEKRRDNAQRLRQMHGLNLIVLRQICNGPRQFQYPVISPSRQIQLTHRRPHQAIPRFFQFTEFSDFRHTHIGIADDIRPLEADALPFSRRLYPLLDQRRTLAQPVAAQLFIIYAWNLTWMSTRSSMKPEMHFWYLVAMAGAWVQGFCESP
jgi:hypothetical protein